MMSRRSRQSSQNEEGLPAPPSKRSTVNRLSIMIRIATLSVAALLLIGYFIARIKYFSFDNKHQDLERLLKRKDDLIQRLVLNNGVDPAPLTVIYKDYPSDNAKTTPPKKDSVEEPKALDDVTPLKHMDVIPESSVWCSGTSKDDRFKNLCYNPTRETWFIVKTNRSIQEEVPMVDRYREPLLYLSSIDNHPYFEWNYVEASPFTPELQNISVRYEDTPHFLFKRLHPDNIMHNLHDDVLNMYFQIKKYITKPTEPGRMELPFSLFSQRILLLDEYEGTGSTRPFQYLSNHPIRFSSYLTLKKTSTDITCFREAFVGNSKITRWYQYGFYDEPQGPIDNLPNGMHVREVASWFTKRIGMPLGNDELYPPKKLVTTKPVQKDNSHLDLPETDLIVIMSRKKNRIMINEVEMAKELGKYYNLETAFLRNEDQNFEDQIRLLRRARIVLGMHGSILVMAMFCRRGTVLLEMYPYAVPGDHYTPYKTMANLAGVDLVYRAWENTHPENNVGHPDNHELHGGLGKLTPEMRELVLNTTTVPRHKCCASPFWLYRIYQDTIVNITEIEIIIDSALKESRERVLAPLYTDLQLEVSLLPGPVYHLQCINETAREPGTLWGSWPEPWTGIKVETWDVLVNNNGGIYHTKSNKSTIQIPGFESGKEIVWFVRPRLPNGEIGPWGSPGHCIV